MFQDLLNSPVLDPYAPFHGLNRTVRIDRNYDPTPDIVRVTEALAMNATFHTVQPYKVIINGVTVTCQNKSDAIKVYKDAKKGGHATTMLFDGKQMKLGFVVTEEVMDVGQHTLTIHANPGDFIKAVNLYKKSDIFAKRPRECPKICVV